MDYGLLRSSARQVADQGAGAKGCLVNMAAGVAAVGFPVGAVLASWESLNTTLRFLLIGAWAVSLTSVFLLGTSAVYEIRRRAEIDARMPPEERKNIRAVLDAASEIHGPFEGLGGDPHGMTLMKLNDWAWDLSQAATRVVGFDSIRSAARNYAQFVGEVHSEGVRLAGSGYSAFFESAKARELFLYESLRENCFRELESYPEPRSARD